MNPAASVAQPSDRAPVFIDDLAAVNPQEWFGGAVEVAQVHSTEAAAFAVQVIAPGKHLQAHHHEGMWDHFVALRGEAVLTLTSPAGERSDFPMRAGSFLAVPPGVTHRVDNAAGNEPFVYLLAQAPFAHGDFHEDEPSGESA